MTDPFGPSRYDPMGQMKQDLGAELVDKVIEELTPGQCLIIALNKLNETDSNRERALAIIKIEEAQHWLWSEERNAQRRRFYPSPTQNGEEKSDVTAPDRNA